MCESLSRSYCLRKPPLGLHHPPSARLGKASPSLGSSLFGNKVGVFQAGNEKRRLAGGCGRVWASQRGCRKVRRWAGKSKERELELNVSICIEEDLPDDPEIPNYLRLNVPMAMKLAFDGLNDATYQTRDTAIGDVIGFQSVELSVLLCNDDFIRKLNKVWRDEDHALDALYVTTLVSVDTLTHLSSALSSLDLAILQVHGLLHLLGFDHELSEEAEAEMEKEEELLLKSLDRKREGSLHFYKPKFSYIFCDMDGTLLNSKSQISLTNAKALKEALSRGVKAVLATGKTVDLAGKDGIISQFIPGVFVWVNIYLCLDLSVIALQIEIYRKNLDRDVCREAFLYSLEHGIPLIAFCEDRCLTLFEHLLVNLLHTIYYEPKVMSLRFFSIMLEEWMSQHMINHTSAATGARANVVQAVPDMLEIVPPRTSKGSGVRMLLDHLGVAPTEIMAIAIGYGENDIDMLELASLGSEKTKAVANVIGVSNDEDGVADAIYRYAF
ncbi:hypothetical protein ACJRO7_013667 [Eucalyptus globulus]|uniref:Haloacid dehalogenase-like hydrolase family protein n=1 Tax=Eucalyptus globulus TaxID=34317 RepID=A0ABD3KXK4_EUCGL